MAQETLIDLYRRAIGIAPDSIQELPKSGSSRQYYRLNGIVPLIGTVGTNEAENRAFLYLAIHFYEKKLPVPMIVAMDPDDKVYLQQDLGTQSLFDLIKKYGKLAWPMVVKAMKALPLIQFKGAEGLDWAQCYPQREFDMQTALWDLNYFKYCFLKTTGIEFDEAALEMDFQKLASDLTGYNCCFMYRDFQSRNIMIHGDKPWFIDFQGGRRGPCHYDVASFLWQARAGFTDAQRDKLIGVYLKAAGAYIDQTPEAFRKTLDLFVLFRTLQVLGAYGFRGYFERKQHFLESIPGALANVRSLLDKNVTAPYPYLAKVLGQMVDVLDTQTKTQVNELTVYVYSFSYKKGIPDEDPENGGGFVFDCRAIHNPGRYEKYRQLSGLDKPVMEFLKKDGEITSFLEHCYALTDASVERYMERGFTRLSIAFGCTGGQHRSVYSAQHMAEHIYKKYNVRVVLEHREQSIIRTFIPNE